MIALRVAELAGHGGLAAHYRALLESRDPAMAPEVRRHVRNASSIMSRWSRRRLATHLWRRSIG